MPRCRSSARVIAAEPVMESGSGDFPRFNAICISKGCDRVSTNRSDYCKKHGHGCLPPVLGSLYISTSLHGVGGPGVHPYRRGVFCPLDGDQCLGENGRWWLNWYTYTRMEPLPYHPQETAAQVFHEVMPSNRFSRGHGRCIGASPPDAS